MIELPQLFFYIFAAMVLGVGLIVTFSTNLLRAAFALFFVLFGIAGFYVLLGGDFIAIVQILVYAGGVNVLLIFGTMLTADVSSPGKSNLSFQAILTAVGAIGFFVLVYGIISSTSWTLMPLQEMKPTTSSLGTLLLREYVLPFEVISFLLLSSLIGALVLVIKGDQT
ncbi:MAG: NADH-quinone oxidoreductase subunit J [Proteobacteria bacterium]|nr:NADH-quinone oxidoreductase subunit J [Pseudomonadota bacterium]